RAFELMCTRALEREAFGGKLADKQTIQNWIADSAAEIQACRLLTLDAAHKIDAGDEARVEISLIKFYAAKVLTDVIDRALQVHGALGLTDRSPLGHMYQIARGAHIYDGPDEVHRMVVSRRIREAVADGEGGPAAAAGQHRHARVVQKRGGMKRSRFDGRVVASEAAHADALELGDLGRCRHAHDLELRRDRPGWNRSGGTHEPRLACRRG